MFEQRRTSQINPSQVESLASLGLSVEYPEEGALVEIGQSEVRVVGECEANAEFGGLGPCLGLFIHTSHPRLTFGCHLPAIEEPIAGQAELERMLRGVRAISSQSTKLSAFIGGLVPTPEAYDRTPQRAKELREQILTQIRSLGVPDDSISVCWASKYTTVDWTIDLREGTAELVHREID